MTLIEKLNRLPPFACRLIARDGSRPLGTSELAKRSELSPMTIKALSRKRSWESVPIGTALKFMEACGVDPLRMRRQIAYLKRTLELDHSFRHLNSVVHRSYFISLMRGTQWRRTGTG